MTSAVGVEVAQSAFQQAGSGAIPTTALQPFHVAPVSFNVASKVITEHHYLHSMPGGTKLSFGVFSNGKLAGAMVIGAGSVNARGLVNGSLQADCTSLTRLWLSDELPRNTESKVISIVIRSLKKHTSLKFLVSYADPSAGHIGTIYQATGWLYTGLSEATPLYDIGDGKVRHSRSLSSLFGTHSVAHFIGKGIPVRTIPQTAKHRYIYFLDKSWRNSLAVPVLPFPKKESPSDEDR